jgi:hypothetical protein
MDDSQPGIGDPRQAALERAGRLTAELIDLVGDLRAAVADEEGDHPAETEHLPGRLQSGDLRSALDRAQRRTDGRPVPHLLG